MTIDNSLNATQLVENVLLGSNITVSNIKLRVNGTVITTTHEAIAKFTDPNGTDVVNKHIGFNEGVIMCTGKAELSKGPNNSSSEGDNLGGTTSDADLENISTHSLYDIVTLEFDFIPISDTVEFQYVFGSEEYHEFVDGNYNDVFGFFISGPNPNGGNYNSMNIAKIPGTNTPVSIDNVNVGNISSSSPAYPGFNPSNSNYFTANGNGNNTGNSNFNSDGLYVQYDGFTKVLTAATPQLIPCETYHIKLAIADARDGIYDSGVFLKAKSFTSASIDITPLNPFDSTQMSNTDTLLEGCSEVLLKFTRTGTSIDTLYYNIGGTAINGVDYPLLSGYVVFLFGNNAYLPISTIYDTISEAPESLTVWVDNTVPCASTNDSTAVTFIIKDQEPIVVEPMSDDTIYCPNDEVTLCVNAQGGNSNLTYLWSTGDMGQSISVTPSLTTTYSVVVSDSCQNQQVERTSTVFVDYEPFNLSTSPDTTICLGDTIGIYVNVSNGNGDFSYSWNNGLVDTDNIFISPSDSSSYTITVIDSCMVEQSSTIHVNVIKTIAVFDFSYIDNLTVQFQNLSEQSDYYIWDFGDSTAFSTEVNPIHEYREPGEYTVTLYVSSQYGCEDTAYIFPITIYPELKFYVPNTFTPNADDVNDLFSGIGEGFVDYSYIIYNRWGGVIFEGSMNEPFWNGNNLKGEESPDGVYVYQFFLYAPNGDVIERLGTISIIR